MRFDVGRIRVLNTPPASAFTPPLKPGDIPDMDAAIPGGTNDGAQTLPRLGSLASSPTAGS